MTPVDVLATVATSLVSLLSVEDRAAVVSRLLDEMEALAADSEPDAVVRWAYEALIILARDHAYFLAEKARAERDLGLADNRTNDLAKQLAAARDEITTLRHLLDDKLGAQEARRRTTWGHLELGRDEGGDRWFLVEGGRREPVHAGTGLVLRTLAGELDVRFETDLERQAVLYTSTDGVHEIDDERVGGRDVITIRAVDGWKGIPLRFRRRRWSV